MMVVVGVFIFAVGSLFATSALDTNDYSKGTGRGYFIPLLNKKPYQSYKC